MPSVLILRQCLKRGIRKKTTGTRPSPFVFQIPSPRRKSTVPGLLMPWCEARPPPVSLGAPCPRPLPPLPAGRGGGVDLPSTSGFYVTVSTVWWFRLLHPISPISSCLLSSPHSTLLLYVSNERRSLRHQEPAGKGLQLQLLLPAPPNSSTASSPMVQTSTSVMPNCFITDGSDPRLANTTLHRVDLLQQRIVR